MSATLKTEPLVDVDDNELNTNQKKDNTNAFGDSSSVRVLVIQYDRIQTYAGNQIVTMKM